MLGGGQAKEQTPGAGLGQLGMSLMSPKTKPIADDIPAMPMPRRHIDLTNQTAVAFGMRIDVDDANRVRVSVLQRADERDICQFFPRRMHDHRR